jgi:hypothetical protein
MEIIEAEAFRTFIRIYALFKSEHLSTNIQLLPYSANQIINACPAWELLPDTYHLNCSACNKVLHTIGNFPRYTPVCECDYTNCAGNKQKSCIIMRMNMFAV